MVFQIGVANVFQCGVAKVFQIGVAKMFQGGVLNVFECSVYKGVSDWYLQICSYFEKHLSENHLKLKSEKHL